MDNPVLPPAHDPLLGRTISGRYRLISRLGSGGMSSVYLARHVMIDRLMAIKCLRRELANDPVQRDRFMREARAVNRINHENIVEITDVGESDDGLVYLVMEYVPGEPLLTALEAGPMGIGRVTHIARQCALALGRAHQMGIVHRDLKPENVLLVPRKGNPDFVKVLDFGIAKILDAPSLTASQQIFGTPGYIAPEYIQSTQIDGRADLYSLGVIMYELVTGALPFDYEYPGDLLIKHVSDLPVAPRARLDTVDPRVESFLLRCLRKDPDERFRDAYHFVDVLDELVEQLGLRPQSWRIRTTAPPPSLEPAAALDSALPGRDTEDLERPDIPGAPSIESVDLALMPVTPAPQPGSSPATPFDPGVDGIMGVRRWRRRFDVLWSLLSAVPPAREGPRAELERWMVVSEDTLVRFEQRAALVGEHQMEAERVQDEVRALRASYGERIEAMGGRLSQLRRQRDALREKERALWQDRQSSAGTSAEETALWAHAAGHAEAVAAQAHVEILEKELVAVSRELDVHSSRCEEQLARITAALADEMSQIEAMSEDLRGPLDRVERFVVDRWTRMARDG